MKIEVVNDCNPDAWDDFIGQFPSATPFHTRAWTDCFKTEQLTPIYLRLLADGKAVGGITGVVVEPRLTILRKIDRKILFFSGPALHQMDGCLIQDCILSLKRYAEGEDLTSLICLGRDYPYTYDWCASKGHVQTLYEYIIDLRGTWDSIRGKMRTSVSEQARKAARTGLTFHIDYDTSILPQLLCLLESTRMRNTGEQFSFYYIPYFTEKILEKLSRTGIARFFVARRSDDVLCVLLAFEFHKRAYALLIGCSEEGYRLRAPAFVWLNVIQMLNSNGIESLNLSGAWPDSDLAFAKISIGAERRQCTGCISPYLQGPIRNVIFNIYRWRDNLSAISDLMRGKRSI